MANSLTKKDFNQALCDVRKAHRLIYDYQSKMLDLTYFIKSKLDFHEYSGNKRFSNPIKPRNDYGGLKIWKGMWAWDFLYSYFFEYHFGTKDYKNCEITMSVFQVSDTGYFDADTRDFPKTELATFTREEKSTSKLLFVVEKKDEGKDWAWNEKQKDPSWIQREVTWNHERMSANHRRDCLNHNENTQIFYSFPLDRFLNEDTTIEALKEFVKYCNDNGISELRLV